ncbi:sterol desaturase family protein [Halioxenophilus sp. WMMB6]|uniref:sterol desaturase family protein n=1 Tax=Halioxenophilus sp. WMMB6 TaxID=3073815 RepID=UPI00295EA4CA|nr:sterol desaturase family protein [Halioxenophilus sp. WMMB6]
MSSWSWPVLWQPLHLFLEPGSRLYWLYLLSAGLLALLWLWRRDRDRPMRVLFDKRYWFNRSTALDCGLLFGNHLIKMVLVVPWFFTRLSGALWLSAFLHHTTGVYPNWTLSPFWLAGAFTLTLFLLDDASRFGLHWLLHKLPWLWRIHKVHHSATSLTPITLYRVHPLEMVLYYLRSLLVFSGVAGLFLFCFSGRINGWDMLGVNIFVFAFSCLGANLRHSPFALQFGVLEHWFISPAQHQIHHSNRSEHADKNLGSALAIWDRMVGSWVSGREAKALQFGLIANPGSGQSEGVPECDRGAINYSTQS